MCVNICEARCFVASSGVFRLVYAPLASVILTFVGIRQSFVLRYVLMLVVASLCAINDCRCLEFRFFSRASKKVPLVCLSFCTL